MPHGAYLKTIFEEGLLEVQEPLERRGSKTLKTVEVLNGFKNVGLLEVFGSSFRLTFSNRNYETNKGSHV